MENRKIHQLEDLTFYVHDDKLQIKDTYAKQNGYILSNDFILKINFYLGENVSYVNSITLIDRHSTNVIHYFGDLKGVKVKNIKTYIEKLLTDYYQHRNAISSYKQSSWFKVNMMNMFSSNYQKDHQMYLGDLLSYE